MNKIIITFFITVLSLVIGNAQNTINRSIKEVVVSANRAQNNNNMSNIQIISSSEIANAPVQSIEDLLEYAMNVDIRQRGGQGVQADISIRGGTFEQVLVMLNSVKMNDPQTGHHTFDIPVSLEQIERIEVITGGASRIFGNYAYTGVINIITKSEMNNSANLSFGNNKFSATEINYHTIQRSIKHNISVSQKRSDGYIDGTDYKIQNNYYQAKTSIYNIETLLNAGYIKKEFGAYGFYSPKYPNQFEITQTTFVSLQFKKEGDIAIENKLYWRKHNDEFILFRSNPSLYHNFHETNVYGMDFNLIQKTKNGSNVLGMEIRADNIISNILGNDLDYPIMIDTDNYYYKGANTTTINLFAEKNIKVQKLTISSGIMMNIDFKHGNEYFPGIDLAYELSDQTKLFTSFSKSMRTPNYTELYYNSPTNIGNKNLKAEYSTNQELGLKWYGNGHNTTFTYYNRDGKNMIDWVLLNGDSIWRTQNLIKLSTSGYELNSKIDLNRILNSKLPISSFSVNYAINQSDTTSNGFQSAYLLDFLSTQFSITAHQIINDKIRLDWRTTRQDREGGYTNYITNQEVEYLPFWLVSARLSYKIFDNGILYLETNNLLDKEYVDFGNISQPGRWSRFGAKITF